MLEIIERIESHTGTPTSSLTLPFDQRQKSRLRVMLDNGDEASIILNRGTVLRDGDMLRSSCGKLIEVRAALEAVSIVRESN